MKTITENFTEDIRYSGYDIRPEDIVIDCGGYKGDFAAEIFKRYGCEVIIFEPINEFYKRICERFEGNPKIRVNNVAVGAEPDLSVKQFKIKGDMTGEHADGPVEEVASISLFEYCEDVSSVALLKLNIESGEFPVLEDLISRGAITKFQNIQVQFHPIIPDAAERRDKIISELQKTHDCVYSFPWVWEGFKLR